MATEKSERSQSLVFGPSPSASFDATQLVSKKPSSVPAIFEHIVEHAPTSPKSIQRSLNVSKSVTFSALDKLLGLGLINRPGRGEYQPSDISLEPEIVHDLGRLRSEKQYEMCLFACQVDSFEVSDLTREFGGYRSAVRETAISLSENGFVQRRGEPFEKSPKAYRVTETASRALSGLDVDDYLGCDGRQVVPYSKGIAGTEFRTAYEIEDAHYIAQSNRRRVRPDEIAHTLNKNYNKTLSRLADMEDRGLLASKALRQKMVFEATKKANRLIWDLRLFTFSKAQQLDFYTIAQQTRPSESITLDELYAALVEMGYRVTPQSLNTAIEELKRAELIEGNSRAGYRFARP